MSKCEILKNKIKKYIGATDYPIKPEVPTGKPARLTQLNMQQMVAAVTNLAELASHQSTGSVSSIGNSKKATPTKPSTTHGVES